MSWRLASRLSVVTLVFLVVLVVAFLGTRSFNNSRSVTSQQPTTNPSGLQGTDLGGIPAPDFRLKDQYGKVISLSQFRGMPVVVTFLYSHCPTVCPLVAEKLHMTLVGLGSNAQKVAILAISVDPSGDTPASVQAFSQAHKLSQYQNWHYLLGSRSALSPIWSSYAVAGLAATATNTSATMSPHSSVVYVLDKQGREQVLLDSDFTPAQLATDLKILLR